MYPITLGVADVNHLLESFEVEKVRRMAQAYLKDESYSAVLTPEEIISLTALVSIVSGNSTTFGSFDQWIPGQNAQYTP